MCVYVGGMQLTRERITEAALAILAEYGLADVSMRRVATSLSVAPGALYWHFSNKQELIASMAEEIVQVLINGPLPDPADLSRELRDALLSTRDGAEVVVLAVPVGALIARLGCLAALQEQRRTAAFSLALMGRSVGRWGRERERATRVRRDAEHGR